MHPNSITFIWLGNKWMWVWMHSILAESISEIDWQAAKIERASSRSSFCASHTNSWTYMAIININTHIGHGPGIRKGTSLAALLFSCTQIINWPKLLFFISFNKGQLYLCKRTEWKRPDSVYTHISIHDQP